MTTLVGHILAVIGVVLIATGYVRNGRNLMLLGVVTLVVGLGLPDMAKGFMEGWKAG